MPIVSRSKLLCLAALAVAAAGVAAIPGQRVCADVPEPSIVPTSWELDFKYTVPERIVVDVPGKGKQTWWYIRYTVTNNSGQDVLFTPSFELLTDTGQQVKAPKTVPTEVFNAIKKRYNDPFLESPLQILGKLLQGDDNAKDGVAIFPTFDSDARRIRVLATGLSGETAVVNNPLTKQPEYLQKTLQLTWDLPGQAIDIDPHPIFKGKSFVMK